MLVFDLSSDYKFYRLNLGVEMSRNSFICHASCSAKEKSQVERAQRSTDVSDVRFWVGACSLLSISLNMYLQKMSQKYNTSCKQQINDTSLLGMCLAACSHQLVAVL